MSTSASLKSRPTRAFALDRLLLPLILLLALGLRLWRLGQANLWWDEALAIWAVRKGLVGVTLWTASDVHPPLYFWSLWSWVQLFGQSPFAMRSLSALWGTLTVLVVYLLGKHMAGRKVGWLAALLVATSRFHVWWSQEMRMYVLAGLLGMLSLYGLLRWLDLHDDPHSSGPACHPHRWLVLNALAAACSLYTIFLSGAFLVAQNILVLLALVISTSRQRRALLWPWIVAQLSVGALVGLWMLYSWGRMPSWSTAQPISISLFLRMYATLLTTGVSVNMQQVLPVVLLILTIFALGGVALVRQIAASKHPRAGTVAITGLTLTLLVSGAMIYAATLPRSLFYTPGLEARYFLPFAPAFWLLLGWGLVAAIERWHRLGWALLGVVAVAWLGVLPGYYQGRCLRDDMQSLTQAVISQAQPGDTVLLDSGGRYPIFLYAYERAKPQSWHPPLETISFSEDDLTDSQVTTRLAELGAQYQRIWLAEVDVHLTDPERLVRQGLEQTWPLAWSQGFGPNALFLYAQEGASPVLAPGYVPDHVINQAFAGGYLHGLDMPLRRVPAGEELRIALLWEEAPDRPVGIQILNSEHEVVRFAWLVAYNQALGSYRQAFSFPIDRTLYNGRYQVQVVAANEDILHIGSIQVACASDRNTHLGAMMPTESHLGDSITLTGYRLYGVPKPGVLLTVDLYWAAVGTPQRDTKVFVQLVGEAFNPARQGPVWGQSDAEPASGSAPTSQWRAGDTLMDRHFVTIAQAAPAGTYQLIVGMYDPVSGKRIEIKDGRGNSLGDHLMLRQIVID